jgi:FKBP12-rapamycin complex-associated protein
VSSAVISVSVSVAPPSNWDQRLELMLHCLSVLRPVLQEYLHIVVPALIKLIDQLAELGPDWLRWQTRAVRTLTHLYRTAPAQSMASRIVHLHHRVLQRYDASASGGLALRDAAMDGLCSMATQLGPQFRTFTGLLNKTLADRGISHPKFSAVMAGLTQQQQQQQQHHHQQQQQQHTAESAALALLVDGGGGEVGGGAGADFLPGSGGDGSGLALLHGEEMIAEYLSTRSSTDDLSLQADPLAGHTADGAGVQRLHVNQQNLQRAWDVSQRSTSDDWGEWIRRFSLELLRESPSPALRSCSALAQVTDLAMLHQIVIPLSITFLCR